MRKYSKDKCLKTLRLLDSADSEIVSYIEAKNITRAVSLLEQCQQGAISVGNAIEKAQGEGTIAVSELETYCEIVYQIHENLLDGVNVNAFQSGKKLKKPIGKAIQELENNIPTEREVVYLPYKASMWDSLEYAWRKDNEDENCTALVIPIPYFDKNPDGSVAATHYEIDEFPSDVPVVKFEDYDFEGRHPDSIYIHNPYDQYNFVTSVFPQFYSSNLKNYTEDLVYIPYFILDEIDPQNKAAVEGNSHFVEVPAVLNANRVIAQSENWRQVYIDVWVNRTSEEERPYWEKKIYGTGSPKVERVKNLKKEDFEIPTEWEKLIKKEDGSSKKVIFYNTSVVALLNNEEAMISKIRDVFRIFKEEKDNVTLWWRPHPLMEATLTSMEPKLWEEYSQLVEEYKKGGWGIYDDSPSMYTAIACSDAYYGDYSSVVWLYKYTGKPIMIQNCEVVTGEEGDSDED